MAFTYFKVKSAKCLCLLPVVLAFVLLLCVGLGLKNLVLFTSLVCVCLTKTCTSYYLTIIMPVLSCILFCLISLHVFLCVLSKFIKRTYDYDVMFCQWYSYRLSWSLSSSAFITPSRILVTSHRPSTTSPRRRLRHPRPGWSR